MEILLVYLAFCAIPAWIASTKQRSPIAWFFISILISPLLAFVIVILIGPGSAAQPTSTIGVADEISKLVALRDSGALSAEEYERQKASLLARPGRSSPRPSGETATCGRCGMFQSPYWKDRCNHCGATYAQYPPVVTPAGGASARTLTSARTWTGERTWRRQAN
jgi:hypothetical protein